MKKQLLITATLATILIANFANAVPQLKLAATAGKSASQPIVEQEQDVQEDMINVMSAEEMDSRIQGTYQEAAPEAMPDPVAEFTPPTGNTTADLVARLAYMEEQIRKLNGQISQLQFELKNVSAQAASAAQVAQTAQATASTTATTAAAMPTTPLADASEQYIARPGDVNGKYVIKVDGAEAGANGETTAQDPAVTEESDFNAGVAQISEQNMAAAKTKFTEFVAKYPDSPKVADAYFWLGEISMDESQYKDGALNYLKSYKADKEGKRAEEALLKSSIALGKLGKKDEACRNLTTLKGVQGLQQLIKEQASNEAIKLGCK